MVADDEVISERWARVRLFVPHVNGAIQIAPLLAVIIMAASFARSGKKVGSTVSPVSHS